MCSGSEAGSYLRLIDFCITQQKKKKVGGGGRAWSASRTSPTIRTCREREFFIDNLLVRIHFIIVMNRWTGLAPWEFEFPFPGSLTSTFLQRKKEIFI